MIKNQHISQTSKCWSKNKHDQKSKYLSKFKILVKK